MKKIILLGSSGSIGQQTVTVARSYPEQYQIVALAVKQNTQQLAALIREFKIKAVCIFDASAAETFYAAHKHEFPQLEVVSGMSGLIALMHHVGDVVVNALVGSVGVLPTIEALKCHKDVALANKETLVMAGDIVMAYERASQGRILPVDSEHSAIFQCLEQNYHKELKQIILTASGGSLRDRSLTELADVSYEDVLAHPNWSMGAKITVDSATMMNKGFEVIEAYHLFQIELAKIHVVLHRESRVHSLVEYVDGSILAHMGVTDMRIPIQYALTYPNRLPLYPSTAFDWSSAFSLQFEPISYERYPALELAKAALRAGGTMPAILNAANEIAVAAFLDRVLPFHEIIEIVDTVLQQTVVESHPTLEQLMETDQAVRQTTQKLIKESKGWNK